MIQYLKISMCLILIFNTYSYEPKFETDKGERVSINFAEVNGKKNYSITDQEPITPASVLKVLSLSYALDILGEDFTFKTKIFYTGKVKDETLIGDIYIVGDGDPYLNHPQLVNIAQTISAFGIRKMTGKLYYDNSLFPQVDALSKIGLGDQTYNPSVGALNAEFNRLSLWTNSSPAESIIPGIPVEIVETRRGFIPTQKFRLKDSEQESWYMKKGARYSRREDLPIRDAGMWTANLLKFHLASFGIEIKEVAKKSLPKKSKLLTIQESIELWSLVALTMEYSNNLLAESITLRACVKDKVSPLNQQGCAKEVAKYINSKKPPLLFNASGLSTDNELSANEISHYLNSKLDKKWGKHSLLSLLSYSGQSGWLRNRLSAPEYNLRVMAKTGSLDFVNNIAGFVRTKSNSWYSFSILHTDDSKRESISQTNSKNYKYLKKQAKIWRSKSLATTDKLLKDFIDRN